MAVIWSCVGGLEFLGRVVCECHACSDAHHIRRRLRNLSVNEVRRISSAPVRSNLSRGSRLSPTGRHYYLRRQGHGLARNDKTTSLAASALRCNQRTRRAASQKKSRFRPKLPLPQEVCSIGRVPSPHTAWYAAMLPSLISDLARQGLARAQTTDCSEVRSSLATSLAPLS